MWQDREVSSVHHTQFLQLIQRRQEREPIAYIINQKEFYGLEFYVNENVLIPRPDSEIIVDEALRYFDPNTKIKLLDMGTGSGCLILTLLKYLPLASGVALDVSKQALEIAKQNYWRLKLDNSIKFLNCDWSNFKSNCKFDLIISNPPYIKKNDILKLQKDVSYYEPKLALDGGKDGLECYKTIIPIIKTILKPKGIAILELGFDQSEEVAKIIKEHTLQIIKYLYDLSGVKRSIVISIV